MLTASYFPGIRFKLPKITNMVAKSVVQFQNSLNVEVLKFQIAMILCLVVV